MSRNTIQWYATFDPRATQLWQVVPLKWYNWLPSLGGRSVRPVLDRIDATLSHVLSRKGDEHSEDADYTFMDFTKEFLKPSNGASPELPLSKNVDRRGTSKVILVGHSAGGWISRILLGSKETYDGKVYGAASYVDALVTLGTPHSCTVSLTLNDHITHSTGPSHKTKHGVCEHDLPGVCRVRDGSPIHLRCRTVHNWQSWFLGLFKDFAFQSYELCCGDGSVWGDGVIPLECALALQGAKHLVLQGVHHFPGRNTVWYGTPDVVDTWLETVSSS